MGKNTSKDEAMDWRKILAESEKKRAGAEKSSRIATELLWTGTVTAVESFDYEADESGEILYNEAKAALGGDHRKGDASKIRAVALAVKEQGLRLSDFENLSSAYKEAVRLTKTVQAEAEEDDAANEAVEAIAEAAPKTATTQESAAKLLLAKGVDGAVVAILDALGPDNEAAHRAFVRALSTEVSSRITAKKRAEAEAKRAEAKRLADEKKAAKEKAAAAKPKGKAKPAPKSGAAKAKPEPKSASKGDPNKKALPVRKAKVEPEVDSAESVADDIEPAEVTETPAPKASAKPKRRAVPVRRG